MSLKIYVFIGHGWNINRTFSISEKKNTRIITLRRAHILFEGRERNHSRLLSNIDTREGKKRRKGSLTVKEYMKKLYNMGNEFKNEFCVFDNKVNNLVPDMLLTTYAKDTETTKLIKLGDLRETKIPGNIILLSELVNMLGDNLVLQIYACRCQLDPFQLDNLFVFKEGEEKIREKIREEGILISEEKKVDELKCDRYEGNI